MRGKPELLIQRLQAIIDRIERGDMVLSWEHNASGEASKTIGSDAGADFITDESISVRFYPG